MSGDVLLGVVLGAQGMQGEVRVKTFTAAPQNLAAYGALRTRDGRRFEIASLRVTRPDCARVHFKGVDDRTAAEALRNVELFVARSALSATLEDEFYHADLVGLRTENASGVLLGEVRAIHNFGAGDVIEVACGNGDTLFFAFTRDAVSTIDVAGKRIVVATEEAETDAAKGASA